MALVKMTRDFPECAGGNTTADIPEEAVNLAMDNGWRLAGKDTKSESKTANESKTETVTEPVKDQKTEKSESKPKNAKRDS